jgi:DNA-binding LacI/PurR family transcriptional regulator
MEDNGDAAVQVAYTSTTLADLARAADVNKSTVSRALRGDPTVGRETRQRIQRLAAELHYVPNASAKRLTRARTDTLAFVWRRSPRADAGADPFLVELLAGMTEEAAASHLDILLSRADTEEHEREVYARILGGRHADGFILADLGPDDPRLEYLRSRRWPHVLFGRPHLDVNMSRRYPYPWVEVDGRAGTRMGTQHLIDLGHQRIAFVSGGTTFHWELDRLGGYQDALRAAGIPEHPELCLTNCPSQESAYQATRGVLEQPNPPTAVFAISDVLAVGAMRAAQDTGRVVGREFSVMGFDGVGLGAYLTPQLTTLRQPTDYVGRLLVRLLAGVLSGTPLHEKHLLLQPELIVRASTASAEAGVRAGAHDQAMTDQQAHGTSGNGTGGALDGRAETI